MILKKRTLLLLLIISLIFGIYEVNASLGITPGITKIDFQPNMSFLVSFNALGASPDQNLIVYADGDLSQYVTFDKTSLIGAGSFTAYVDLPEYVNKSGKNRLYIMVKENNSISGGIGAILEVGAMIMVKVPYPGKYAEINAFNVANVNEGEPIHFYLELNNLGSEDMDPSAKVDVYSNGVFFGSQDLGTKKVAKNSIEIFEASIKEKKYMPGSYEAFVSVDLNDENNTLLKDNRTFYVGNLLVDIIDWTKEVNKSKINPFSIEIESKWNNNLKNVYAEVNLTRDGKEADFFKTPSIEIKKWEKGILKGYLNAENLEEGKYKANITLFFEDKTKSKLVDIRVADPEKPKGDAIMLIIYIAIIVSVIIVTIIIAFYLILLKKIQELKSPGRGSKNKPVKHKNARKN